MLVATLLDEIDRPAQALENRHKVRMSNPGYEDEEFVASPPAHHVGVPEVVSEGVRDRLNDRVATVVPELIVDRLEVVEVDERDRVVAAASLRPLAELGDDGSAVVHPREFVGRGPQFAVARGALKDPLE